MTGIHMMLVASQSGLSVQVVSGSYTTGGKVPITYNGYSDGTVTGSSFGGRSPTTYTNGSTIKGIYHENLNGRIAVMLSGSVLGAVNSITIGGSTYPLTGTDFTTYTLFNSTSGLSNPFTGTLNVTIR